MGQMTQPFDRELEVAQAEQRKRFSASQYIDVHCHCLPGLDDGPASMAEAVVLCKALAADGINIAVATPHQLGRFDGCHDAQDIREAVANLNKTLRKKKVALTILPGADVRVDERIPQLLQSDHILTLADSGRYVLLELPQETFIDPQPLLAELSSAGVRVVISHPERNMFLVADPGLVLRWARYNPCVQVTASSLVGGFGPTIQQAAWHFLNVPLPSLVATDAHDTKLRAPCMAKAFDLIAARQGILTARKLCIYNPTCVLSGQNAQPVVNVVRQEVQR